MNSSPISSDDLAIIKEHGVPLDPGPEFVLVGEYGVIHFTDRGRRLYRLAMLLHGLSPEPVEGVHDLDDLRELSLTVKKVRAIYASDAAERARTGRIPARARPIVDAVMCGTTEDLHAAVAHRLKFESAGDNVVPVVFGKSKR